MVERKGRTRPPEQSKTPESHVGDVSSIIAKSREQGPVHFGLLTEDEKLSIAQAWKTNRESFSASDSVEIAEQLIANDLISDQELVSYVCAPKTPRRELALYLASVVNTERYRQSFQFSFFALKASEQREIANRFIEESPQLRALVAPMVDFSEIWVHEDGHFPNAQDIRYTEKRSKDPRRRKEAAEPFPYVKLTAKVNSAEEIDSIYRGIFDIIDAHKAGVLKEEPRLPVKEEEDIPRIDLRSAYVLADRYFSTILGRTSDLSGRKVWTAAELYKRGIIDEARLNEILDAADMADKDVYTSDEQEKIDVLNKRIGTYITTRYLPDSYKEGRLDKELFIQSARERERITRDAIMRNADFHVRSLEVLQETQGFSRIDYVTRLLQGSTALFARIEDFGLTDTEVDQVVLRVFRGEETRTPDTCDMDAARALYSYYKKRPEGDLGRKNFTRNMLKVVGSGGPPEFGRSYDLWLRELTPEDARAIEDASFLPTSKVWLYNIEKGIEIARKRGMDIGSWLQHGLLRNPKTFLENYGYVKDILAREVGVERMHSLVRECVNNQPHLIVASRRFEMAINDAFSPAQKAAFIRDAINQNIDFSLTASVLEDADLRKEYQKELKQVFSENQDLVVTHAFCEGLGEVIGKKKLIDTLIASKERVDWRRLMRASDNLIERVMERDKACELVELFGATQNIETLLLYVKKAHATGSEGYKEVTRKDMANIAALRNASVGAEREHYRIELIAAEQAACPERSSDQQLIVDAISERASAVLDECLAKYPLVAFGREWLWDFPQYEFGTFSSEKVRELTWNRPDLLFCEGDIFETFPNWASDAQKQELARIHRAKLGYHVFRKGIGDYVDFEQDRLGKRLGLNVAKDIAMSTPLGRVSGKYTKITSQGYYRTVIGEMHDSRIALYFKHDLEAHATRIEAEYGKQLSVPSDIDGEFFELARSIALFEASPYSEEIIALAVQHPDKHKILDLWKFTLLEGLVTYDFEIEISDILSHRDTEGLIRKLESVVRERFCKSMDIPLVEGAQGELSVHAMRAIMIYNNGLEGKDAIMIPLLKQVVQKKMNGSLGTWRAWGVDDLAEEDRESHLHRMRTEKLLPEKLELGQYLAWNEDKRLEFFDMFKMDMEVMQKSIESILEQAVKDGHLEGDYVNTSPEALSELRAYSVSKLQELVQRKKDIVDALRAYRKNKEGLEGIDVEAMQDELLRLNEEIAQEAERGKQERARLEAIEALTALTKLTTAQIDAGRVALRGGLKPVQDVFASLNQFMKEAQPEFVDSLQRIEALVRKARQDLFGDQRASVQKLELRDDFDFETHLCIGEKPVPSCQHYDSSYEFNKGLLALQTDPAVRVIRMEDERGEMVGRCILRLLSDKEGNPHLMMERVYSTNPHPGVEAAFIRMAYDRAKDMGVTFFLGEGKSYEHPMVHVEKNSSMPLYSTGSRNRYIYSDAGGGLASGGVFEVDGRLATVEKK